MQLRDYQTDCVDSIRKAFDQYQRVLAVLPTGCGKTEIFVELAKHWDRGRVMVIVPMIQLSGQAAKKIRQRTGIMPDIERASQWANESEWARNQFVVASKQTLCGKSERYKRFEDIGLVIVDEAHLAVTKQYHDLIEYFVQERNASVLGVTATPQRGDKKGLASCFDHCCYTMDMGGAIQAGWLCEPRTKLVQLESLDLKQVRQDSVDFIQSDLARVMEDDKVCYEIAAVTAAEIGTDRTVVFTASVAEARKVACLLVDQHGVKADWICGDKKLCTDERRHRILTEFDDGQMQVIVNCGVLTTGWDSPHLEHIVLARPTKSLGLFTQIIGRGTRPLPGVVDFEGSQPDTRKAAIAASAKPWFKLTDLRDNALEHKLVSVVDVLGTAVQLKDRSELQKQLADRKSMTEALDAVRAAKEAAALQAERARLARQQAAAKYHTQQVDLFDSRPAVGKSMSGAPKVPRMTFGKHKGTPIASVPTGYLTFMVRQGWLRKGWLRDAVHQELANRNGKKHVSGTQALQTLLKGIA